MRLAILSKAESQRNGWQMDSGKIMVGYNNRKEFHGTHMGEGRE
jgi:hypothetical protein